MRNVISMVVLAVVVALIAIVALVNRGRASSTPPTPSFVFPDGHVIPEFVSVAGPDGKKVICGNGRPLRVSTRVMPPQGPRPNVENQDETLVPRCGKGANPHLNPVWVPLGKDPLR